MKNYTLKNLLLALSFLSTNLAFADNTTNNFQTNATLNSTCSINANDLSFGTLVLGSTNSSSSKIDVLCSNSVAFSVSFNSGLYGIDGAPASRLMKGSTGNESNIPYNLFKDAGKTRFLGGTTAVSKINGVGTGVLQSFNIYAEAYPTYVTPDIYSDTSTVTIVY